MSSWSSLRREVRDGRGVLVKTARYDLTTESDGLAALRRAGARTPDVLVATADELVLDEVVGDGDWSGCGARLARMHRAVGPSFGWDRDGWIGPLPMGNTRSSDWPTFFVSQRILPYLDGCPDPVRRRILAAVEDGRCTEVLDHGAVPSLVHGDLWAGNVVGGEYLVDPAVHHADRELDLAMADLFGGFPPAFWEAYAATWAPDAGWQRRRDVLQLFHLLVHVQIEGVAYVSMVEARLDRLGW